VAGELPDAADVAVAQAAEAAIAGVVGSSPRQRPGKTNCWRHRSWRRRPGRGLHQFAVGVDDLHRTKVLGSELEQQRRPIVLHRVE
jgi:hypothetical protein